MFVFPGRSWKSDWGGSGCALRKPAALLPRLFFQWDSVRDGALFRRSNQERGKTETDSGRYCLWYCPPIYLLPLYAGGIGKKNPQIGECLPPDSMEFATSVPTTKGTPINISFCGECPPPPLYWWSMSVQNAFVGVTRTCVTWPDHRQLDKNQIPSVPLQLTEHGATVPRRCFQPPIRPWDAQRAADRDGTPRAEARNSCCHGTLQKHESWARPGGQLMS